jgi:hypothetical protein
VRTVWPLRPATREQAIPTGIMRRQTGGELEEILGAGRTVKKESAPEEC